MSFVRNTVKLITNYYPIIPWQFFMEFMYRNLITLSSLVDMTQFGRITQKVLRTKPPHPKLPGPRQACFSLSHLSWNNFSQPSLAPAALSGISDVSIASVTCVRQQFSAGETGFPEAAEMVRRVLKWPAAQSDRNSQTRCDIDSQTDRQADRQTGRRADGQTGRRADGQTGRRGEARRWKTNGEGENSACKESAIDEKTTR